MRRTMMAVFAGLVLGLAALTSGCGEKPPASGDVQRLTVDDYNAKVRADMGKAMSAKPGK